MSSMLERFSKARRISPGAAFGVSRAMASMALRAERNSRNEGTTFMPKSASTATTMRTAMRAMMLTPVCIFCCRMCFLPLLVERPEAAKLAQVEPDEKGLADDVLVRDEAPHPTVARVVSIVAHHEVMAGRHRAREAGAIVVAIATAGSRRQHRGGRVILEQDLVLRIA